MKGYWSKQLRLLQPFPLGESILCHINDRAIPRHAGYIIDGAECHLFFPLGTCDRALEQPFFIMREDLWSKMVHPTPSMVIAARIEEFQRSTYCIVGQTNALLME